MKVALINPDNGKAIKKENLGLLGIATYLKQRGHTVRYIDEVAEEDARESLRTFGPDVVGISFMTLFANRAIQIAQMVRQSFPNARIVFGGAHPSAAPREFASLVDAVIVGEGEISMQELLEKNTWSDKIIEGKIEQNLDAFPMPDRSLINTRYYLNQRMGIAGLPLKSLSMSTSRGCPYRCIFCQNSKRTVPVRTHSIGRVIKEITSLVNDYGAESIAFVDENFAVNKSRLVELCQQIIGNRIRITWECQTSSNLVDEALLALIKEAGAIQVAFGFESGSQRILEVIGKKASVERNQQAIVLSKKAGLKVRGCFIIGNPTETLEDIRKTQAFIRDNDIDYTGVFLATPFPGTKLWDYCVEQGLFKDKPLDYDLFTTGADSPSLCSGIDGKTLNRIYAETVLLSMRKNYSLARLFLKTLKYPGDALQLLKNLIRKS